MSSQGFDTWIVEVRGAGLSMREYGNSAASGSVTIEDACGGIQPLDNQSTFEAASLQSSGGYASDCDDLGIVALDEPPLLTELSNFFDRISKLMEEAVVNGNFHEITEKSFCSLRNGRELYNYWSSERRKSTPFEEFSGPVGLVGALCIITNGSKFRI